jgi:hypothetical protein
MAEAEAGGAIFASVSEAGKHLLDAAPERALRIDQTVGHVPACGSRDARTKWNSRPITEQLQRLARIELTVSRVALQYERLCPEVRTY